MDQISKQLERCGLTRFQIEHDSGDNNDRHKEEDDEEQTNGYGVLGSISPFYSKLLCTQIPKAQKTLMT